MLKARDFKKQAWNSLNGLWGTMALVTLVFVAIMSLSGGIPFGFYIIGGPLTLGATQIYMSIIRKNRKPEIGQLFDGFNNFGSSLILMLLNQLLIFFVDAAAYYPRHYQVVFVQHELLRACG